ncbi:hypothetical protein LIER_17935 [Lithospermum erythrorhizon]|uniref:Uncharacterized protein n=1 Tax=Lithospermum erythrorhizon TaxID=34254 RepID=A0AAV3QDG7_LITER
MIWAGSMCRGPDEPRDRNMCTLVVPEESFKKGRPHDEIRSIPFDERNTAKVFKIGTKLGEEHGAMLIRVLMANRDTFAWEPKDMRGVDPEVSSHQLYVDPHYKPINQKKRTFSEEKGEAIPEEVDKLMGEKAIGEFLFPKWLANVVLVPKPNGPWRMCTDSPTSTKPA